MPDMPDPIGIQRRRVRGFRLQAQSPDGRPVIYVGRPSPWGNPWTIGAMRALGYQGTEDDLAHACYAAYEAWLTGRPHWAHASVLPPRPDLTPLRGKHLACWCPVDFRWCHREVLLRLANRGGDDA